MNVTWNNSLGNAVFWGFEFKFLKVHLRRFEDLPISWSSNENNTLKVSH